MYDFIVRKWLSIDERLSDELKKYSEANKKENEQKMNKFFKDIDAFIDKKPKGVYDKEKWKLKFEEKICSYLERDEIFNLKYLEDEIRNSLLKSTTIFVEKAKKFDKNLPKEHIAQAVRNLWIVNILQILLKEEVKVTKSAFAYSLLYPYTDNFLDDVNISEEDKKIFNERLLKRLEGNGESSNNKLEEKIDILLKYIEEEYERNKYQKVHESLIEIQKNQMKSLVQQSTKTKFDENDILAISIRKGGTSVLADGYLVKGRLEIIEERFCLIYGFLLQLIDDLQDVDNDKKDKNITLMTLLSEKTYLDSIASKLINFSHYIFRNIDFFKGEKELKKVMEDNCRNLILISIALNKQYFSKEYINLMEQYMPFSISYIEKASITLSQKLKKKEILA